MAAKDQDAKADELRQLFAELKTAYARAGEAVPQSLELADEGAHSRFTEENRRANQSIVDLVTKFAEQKKATPAQVALAWLLAQKPWIVPIPGTTRVSRLEENLGGAALELTADDVRALNEASSAIKIAGERYPETHRKLIDR